MADLPTKINLTIVTRERKIIDAQVDEVILPGHRRRDRRPARTHAAAGACSASASSATAQGNTVHRLVISWGFAEVLPDRVIVLAERGFLPTEIDRAAAEQERVAAEKRTRRTSRRTTPSSPSSKRGSKSRSR